MTLTYTRRTWLANHTLAATVLVTRVPISSASKAPLGEWYGSSGSGPNRADRAAAHAARLDAAAWQELAHQAVDAAQTVGARYVDARLTRIVIHQYHMAGNGRLAQFDEMLGVGVRALVDGYWGFAASAELAPDDVVQVARDAVAQARENAKGTPRIVELGVVPVAVGTWATPIRIDPFVIPIEEKLDHILYWQTCAARVGVPFLWGGLPSWLQVVRQERVVATSDGALFTQTLFESAGNIVVGSIPLGGGDVTPAFVRGLDAAGQGWELFLDNKIPEQFPQLREEIQHKRTLGSKPSTIGRYPLVCDGATMAALVDATLGVATQLDRALGYEANAGGTSFIDDPLAMVGMLQVASPVITLTANRSALAELATVRWDDEGIVPQPFTLVKDGVLVDFQTTREQAAWLAPYYQRHGRPVRSNGCAAAQDAHAITMQQTPNLSLEPSASATRLEDLVADVADGILVEGGSAQCDFQGRTGLLVGALREIKRGRLGRSLSGGAVLFDAKDLWSHIAAVGGPSTQMRSGITQYQDEFAATFLGMKGQPPQLTSHSVRAAAALLPNQPLINPDHKA